MRETLHNAYVRWLMCRIPLEKFSNGLLLTMGLLCGSASAADDAAKENHAIKSDIAIERVLGPEYPDQYKHPATFTELTNGDLYLAYYRCV